MSVRPFVPVLAFVFLVSCSGRRATAEQQQRGGVPAEARGAVLLTFISSEPYCGGADVGFSRYPDRQMALHTFQLRTGSVNDTLVPPIPFTTDSLGHAHLTLPEGEYGLIDPDRLDGRLYRQLLRDHAQSQLYQTAVDTACLLRWLRTPRLVFAVRAGRMDTVHVRFAEPCPWYTTPCVQYSGPLPP